MTASSLRPALQAKVMDSSRFSSSVTKYLSIVLEDVVFSSLQLKKSPVIVQKQQRKTLCAS